LIEQRIVYFNSILVNKIVSIMRISIAVVKEVAKDKFHLPNNIDTQWFIRRFRNMFGCSPKVVAALFNTLLQQTLINSNDKVHHLMWALAFLKSYNTENHFSTMYHVSEKTIRKWIWYFLDRLSQLDVVSHWYITIIFTVLCMLKYLIM
jgi:hypothetical protein